MTGLVGSAASAESERLAEIYGVTASYIYRMTEELRRGQRKKRSDAGRRRFDIVAGTDTFEAAALVLGGKLDPDQALLTAKANGHDNLPSLATMQRLLRERQLDRKSRKTGRRNHRRFEAEAPLDLIQIDCTALKVRWKDVKTRRILRIEGIDKNHPQMDAGKIRVWQIMAIDDHSRRRFMRYVVANHITSRDMVRFCCELFCEWGVPTLIYTDNGPEFKAFFAKAIKIINSIAAISATGGCEHFTHMPNNPQATGKVEVAHLWAEKMDRYIGLAEQRGMEVTVDKLDMFAESICRNYNEVRVHRETGETPLARWHGKRILTRLLPGEVIQAALLFDEAERTLTDTMTVRVGKIDYRIPARDAATGKASPFRVGMRLSVIVPHEIDMIFVTLSNGEQYEIDKEISTADVALQYKTAAPSEAEVLTKTLRAHHEEKNREAKAKKKLTGEVYQVPHFNHEIAVPDTNIHHFPHTRVVVTAEELGQVVPVPTRSADTPVRTSDIAAAQADKSVRTPAYVGKPITYWQAVAEYSDKFSTKDDAKSFLLELFPGEAGEVPVTQVEAAIDSLTAPHEEGLRLVG